MDVVPDDLAVFRIVGHSDRRKVRLPDGAVTGQIAVAVGFQEAGIDAVLSVVQHLRVRRGNLLRRLRVSNIGEYAVLDQGRFCKGPLFVHGDDVAENDCFLHRICPP